MMGRWRDKLDGLTQYYSHYTISQQSRCRTCVCAWAVVISQKDGMLLQKMLSVQIRQ